MIVSVGDLLKALHSFGSKQVVQILHHGELIDITSVSGASDGTVLIMSSEASPVERDENTADLPDDAANAVEQCDHILTLCDDVPERAEGFAADIADKVQSVRDWIIENKHVTPKQLSALEGWEAGISKWIR